MEQDERFKTLRAEIAARLEKVRGALTDDEFSRLVDDVAANARRSEIRSQGWASRGLWMSSAGEGGR